MTINGVAQIALYFAVLLALVKPLGWYMAKVYEGRCCGLDRIFSPIERLIYRMCKVDPAEDMQYFSPKPAAMKAAE